MSSNPIHCVIGGAFSHGISSVSAEASCSLVGPQGNFNPDQPHVPATQIEALNVSNGKPAPALETGFQFTPP